MTIGRKKENFFRNNYPSIARKVEIKINIVSFANSVSENNYYTGGLYINQSLVVTKKALSPTIVTELLLQWYEDRYETVYDSKGDKEND